MNHGKSRWQSRSRGKWISDHNDRADLPGISLLICFVLCSPKISKFSYRNLRGFVDSSLTNPHLQTPHLQSPHLQTPLIANFPSLVNSSLNKESLDLQKNFQSKCVWSSNFGAFKNNRLFRFWRVMLYLLPDEMLDIPLSFPHSPCPLGIRWIVASLVLKLPDKSKSPGKAKPQTCCLQTAHSSSNFSVAVSFKWSDAGDPLVTRRISAHLMVSYTRYSVCGRRGLVCGPHCEQQREVYFFNVDRCHYVIDSAIQEQPNHFLMALC